MGERRTLVDGLKQTPATLDPRIEKEFVFQVKEQEAEPVTQTAPAPQTTAAAPPRSPISTRIRADLASTLKRLSLERQLAGLEPHTLQDMLEQALDAWLKTQDDVST